MQEVGGSIPPGSTNWQIRVQRDKLIIRILADTGMRAGELVGLRPADLIERNRPRTLPLMVAKIVGHSSLVMIQRNYEHLVVDDTYDALSKRLRDHP